MKDRGLMAEGREGWIATRGVGWGDVQRDAGDDVSDAPAEAIADWLGLDEPAVCTPDEWKTRLDLEAAAAAEREIAAQELAERERQAERERTQLKKAAAEAEREAKRIAREHAEHEREVAEGLKAEAELIALRAAEAEENRDPGPEEGSNG